MNFIIKSRKKRGSSKKSNNSKNSKQKSRVSNRMNKGANSLPFVIRDVKFPRSTKKMAVPNTKDTMRSAVVRRHIKGGSWEIKIAKLLDKYCKPNSVAIDIGGFIGTHTLTLVDGVGEKGKVYTFEPQPWAFNMIKKTLKENKISNVNVYNAGVSDKKGFIEFCSDETGGSTICTEKHKSKKSWKSTYKIKLMPLDSLNLKNISVMKIDVEGHEISTLEGAKNTILSNKPAIIIEVWNRDKKKREFQAFMKSINYRVTHISGEDYLCLPK